MRVSRSARLGAIVGLFAAAASAKTPRSLATEAPADAPRGAAPGLRVGPVYHGFGGVAVGRGLRLNNPYRLQTELGDDAESLSLTATYLDVHVGVAVGGRGALFHGAVVHGSFATDGIAQEVVTPAYAVIVRLSPRWGLLGRAGIPIVIRPDLNAGFEVATGGRLHVTEGLGLTASLVGSMFYGAATLDTPRTAIPILSLEAGVFYDYEGFF